MPSLPFTCNDKNKSFCECTASAKRSIEKYENSSVRQVYTWLSTENIGKWTKSTAHIQQIFPLNASCTVTLICSRMVKKALLLTSGWIYTMCTTGGWAFAKNRKGKNTMDVEWHGEKQMGKPGGTFSLHTFIFVFLSLWRLSQVYYSALTRSLQVLTNPPDPHLNLILTPTYWSWEDQWKNVLTSQKCPHSARRMSIDILKM